MRFAELAMVFGERSHGIRKIGGRLDRMFTASKKTRLNSGL